MSFDKGREGGLEYPSLNWKSSPDHFSKSVICECYFMNFLTLINRFHQLPRIFIDMWYLCNATIITLFYVYLNCQSGIAYPIYIFEVVIFRQRMCWNAEFLLYYTKSKNKCKSNLPYFSLLHLEKIITLRYNPGKYCRFFHIGTIE